MEEEKRMEEEEAARERAKPKQVRKKKRGTTAKSRVRTATKGRRSTMVVSMAEKSNYGQEAMRAYSAVVQGNPKLRRYEQVIRKIKKIIISE